MGLHTAAVRRLTGDAHLDHEFATTWSTYDLDAATRAVLAYAVKLTESPSLVGRDEIAKLTEAGWDDGAVWEITALVSFFNYSGRLEAATGMPPDEIPEQARLAEAGGK